MWEREGKREKEREREVGESERKKKVRRKGEGGGTRGWSMAVSLFPLTLSIGKRLQLSSMSVAQLVEHLPSTQNVAGLNPT